MNDTTAPGYAVSLCGEYVRDITGVNAADEFVDDVLTRTAPSGEHVMGALGPRRSDDSFSAQLHIAIEHPHAYLRWGDGDIGTEPGRPTPEHDDAWLVVEEHLGDIVAIPATRLRVSPGRAREAVRQYVATGERPDCVDWVAVTLEQARQYWRTVWRKVNVSDASWEAPMASHAEVKAAIQMQAQKLKHRSIVINNPEGPCGDDLGCQKTLDRFIPVGSTLTVYWPGGNRIFGGKELPHAHRANALP